MLFLNFLNLQVAEKYVEKSAPNMISFLSWFYEISHKIRTFNNQAPGLMHPQY